MCEARLPAAAVPGGVRIALKVTPRRGREGIDGIAALPGGPALEVAVAAAPEDGKANAALLRLLAREWKLPRARFAIVSGTRTRHKVVHIDGDPHALLVRIATWWRERHG